MPGGRLTPNPLAPDPVTDPEDRALVFRAKSGDAAALEELVVRHQTRIYNIVVRADSCQLEQVLLNLYSNAAHAMKAAHGRGVLTVRTMRRAEEADVEITDSGPGIPAEHLAKIFDPFFTTKPAGEGIGLGLSLVLGIIPEPGGRVPAANVPGSGARFVISLPLREQAEVAATPAA